MTHLRGVVLLTALLALAPAGASAQEDGGGIEGFLEGLERELEETAPVILDEAREGLGAAERLGRNLYDRWRICGDAPQSAAPVCRVLTDGAGGALDPSPGSLDRVFERIDEIAAPYNDRSRTARSLAERWAWTLDLRGGEFSRSRAVGAIFERIRGCESWPCVVLDRELLESTVSFLLEHDTEGYPAALAVQTAYGFSAGSAAGAGEAP